ncbi:MAG: ArgE/DapE family deacylase [Actinomycetota bacterium]|nr:ArgE/DapE family deacylase [Actinomycetota bacterium]
MQLSPQEQRVVDAVVARREALVALTSELVAYNTVTHTPGAPPRQERALQEHLAALLRRHGADVVLHEPDASALRPHAMVPEELTFEGRPQLVARFRGNGGGRTLLLNGHVDVVDVEPRANWTLADPFAATVHDGRLYGRGTCDMKGGVASMVVAACTLAALGVPLAGDLIVNTVTEEESTGAGGLFAARLLQADAAIVPEPSSLAVWVACRGSLLPRITVHGRAGHAGIAPLPPEQGGAVNAIEKMTVVLAAIERLREHWSLRPKHRYLSPGDCVPTIITGGEWLVTYPATCALECHVEYLPERADEHGYGSLVEREFEQWIAEAAARDAWLREHPPEISWGVGGVPPAEVATDAPIVQTLVEAGRDLGQPHHLGGLDNWHDGATLTVEAGIPAVCFGPGDIHRAHAADEYVPIDDLVACAQRIALTALRFCNSAA